MSQTLEQIDDYSIIHRLGKGGMGSVYKVCPSNSDTIYALKILDPFEIMEDIIGIPGLRKIFRAEADIMRTFNSSSVVKVHHSGEDYDGRPYFVMEFFCRNLGEILGEGFWMDQMSRVIPPAATLDTIRQLLQGLSVLHGQNIVHRDIKPFNLLVSGENQLKICDFGMALQNGQSPVSNANMIVGSPFYAAPEQNSQSAELDGRADLYSAAVIMFRMLTGVFPSPKHFPLASFNPELTPQWDRYLQKGLQRTPEKRFRDCGEMLAGLEELQNEYEDSAIRDDWPGFAEHQGTLRGSAANLKRAENRQSLEFSDQMQPLSFHNSLLKISENQTTVHDTSHGLIWQRNPSPARLDTLEAEAYIGQLNICRDSSSLTYCWRLPTISELLSLLRPGRQTLLSDCFPGEIRWLWSSDRYGKLNSCYLDCVMGVVGNLDRSCHNHVLAVASL